MGIRYTIAALLAVSVASSTYADKPPAKAGQGNPAAKPPTSYVLESAALRLEVSSTYAFQLTEKSSGNVLLNENRVTFTVGASALVPTAITNVAATATTLEGDLSLNATTSAHVAFSFLSPEHLRITLTCNNAVPSAVAERFTDVTGERYYGIWENALPAALDNRGISSGYDGKEVTTTKDVFASSRRAPFYFTNKNYGIYANSQAQGSYAFGVSGTTTMKFNSSSLQYNILHGTTPKAILALHNTVAGPAFMPPDWAFSTIFWRDDFHQLPVSFTGTNAQALVLDDAAKLAANRIHAGAIWIDRPYGTETRHVDSNVGGWGNMDFDASFPDPSAMAKTLNDGGVKLIVWVANKANNHLYTEGSALGYLFTGYSQSPSVDLRTDGAYAWFKGEISMLEDAAALSNGRISGFKIDRGGEGEMPEAVINTQTTLLHRLLKEDMQAHNGQDFFNFTRNINDQGRRYAAVWSGDPKCTWLGLQSSVKNGLRSGLINFPMWGCDTGGYSSSSGWTEELFSRWIEFTAFCPMMEIIQGPQRDIFYTFSPAALARTKKYTDLHHDLIPYTRSAMAAALQSGVPVMRALVLEFPTDTAVADMADEYMFGPNILVAPVLTQGATSRSVYLPVLPDGGQWIDYNNPLSAYASGQTITAAATVDVIPTFVRAGAIIPRGDVVRANNTWDASWTPSLRMDLFPGPVATSFDYNTGTGTSSIALTPITNGDNVTAAALGMPATLNFYLPTAPVTVTLNGMPLTPGAGYTYDTGKHVLAVSVPGNQAIALNVDYTNVVAGRYVFYKGSAFAAVKSDNAIATDKAALFPGQSATFANYTSHSRGLNGLMIDIAGPTGNFSAADLDFRFGNDSSPAAWPAAPAPASIVTRPTQGVNGSTRIEIAWADNALQNRWLQVTLKGGTGSTSGLAVDDVFFFGNAIGEAGNDPARARVDAIDELRARGSVTANASITNACDFDRNGAVDDNDPIIARTHLTSFLNELLLIAPPAAPVQATAQTLPTAAGVSVPVTRRLASDPPKTLLPASPPGLQLRPK